MKSLLVLAALLFVVTQVESHGHNHGHDHGHHHGHDHGHHHGHAHDHGHDHGHGHEHEPNPAFKYSRAANEKPPQQQQQHHGHSHDDETHHVHSHNDEPSSQKFEKNKEAAHTKMSIALYAMSSTLLISIAPFFILFLIPIKNKSLENQSLLKVLLAFASGSLLGDAFLHLIPHALSPHDHSSDDHSHSHEADAHDHSASTGVGLWILAGIMAFLLVEKLVRNLKGGEHGHSHGGPAPATVVNSSDEASKTKRKDATKPATESKKDESKDDKKAKEVTTTEEIQVAGYLNLAADFAHNFTDGLAIGASYLAGHQIGLVTTLTILFHEVPHEIGDFAILIQSGCSKKKAILLQLVTALGALSGTFLSLVFESAMSGFATSCILPFTAGGFIYIATVSILPELKESSGFFQSLKEVLALCTGIFIMVIIVLIE
jgi:zinc transporter 7